MIHYRERLWPGPGTFLAFALVVPAALLVFLPIDLNVGIVVAVVLYAIAVAALLGTTPTITVTDSQLRAGAATLQIEYIGVATALTGSEATRARGVDLDARAWLLLRGWVRDVVRVENTDSNDPAPYWVISSRHPDHLAAALNAAAAAAHAATAER